MICANCHTLNLKGMLFCAKCGRSLAPTAEDEAADLPRLVWQVGEGTPQTYLLTKAVTTIGRVSGNDIILPETGVSRQHTRIERQGDRLVIIDLGSLNGTWVNDERVEQARELRNGDIIQIGRTTLQVLLPAALASAMPAAPARRLSETDTVLDPHWQGGSLRPAAPPAAEVPPPDAPTLHAPLPPAEAGPLAPATGETAPGPADLAEAPPMEAPAPVAAVEDAHAPDASEATARAPASAAPAEPSTYPTAPQTAFWLVLADETRVPLGDVVTIGRGETNTVVLSQDRQVSRHHARIVLHEGLPRLEDLGSANGTFVNGERLTEPRLLQDGDQIRIGGSTLRVQRGTPRREPAPAHDDGTVRAETSERTLFVDDDAGSDHTISELDLEDVPAPAASARASAASLPVVTDRPRLNVTWGPQSGQSFVLDREVVLIGRAGGKVECDIALEDKAVSSPHAKLVRSGDLYLLHDLESTNGTYVNYEPLSQPRVLQDGDLIKVGKTTLLYRTPVAALPPLPTAWLPQQATGRGKLLTFFSLKGGVGTTTVAVNTALLLRELTREPTVLVDLALERASVTAQLNLEVRRALDDLAQLPSIDADTVRGIVTRHSSGLDVLAAPSTPQTAELVTAEILAQLFPILKAQYRWIVLDTAATFSDANLNAFDQADLVVLLGAPDLVSLKTLQACLDVFTALQTTGERRLLLLNNVYPRARLEREEMEKALGERIDLVLPYGEEVLHSIDLGVPLTISQRAHPFVMVLDGFVRKVAEIKEEPLARTRAARGGFWLRLKRLLARR